MTKVMVTEDYLGDIADAIRGKNGSSDTYTPGQMAAAIASIPTGGITPTGTVNITQNGAHDVTQYASANVNVSGGGGNTVLCEIDFTKGDFTINNVIIGSSGAVFDNSNDWLLLPFARNGMTVELDVSSMNLASGGYHKRFIMASYPNGFIYRNSGVWGIYNGSWYNSEITDGSFFANSTLKIHVDSQGYWHIYKNDVLVWEPNATLNVGAYAGSYTPYFTIGSTGGQSIDNVTITAARVY